MMMGRVHSIILASWILCATLISLATAQQPYQGVLGPGIADIPLWCIFCRSDKNPACINKAGAHEEEFTKPCTNETMLEFRQDIEHDKPRRPIPAPRSGPIGQTRLVCYRMYTVDQSFTLRTCTISTGLETADEECNPCMFDGVRAKCCSCSTTNCNIKNSDATRVFKNSTLTLVKVLIVFSSLSFMKTHVM